MPQSTVYKRLQSNKSGCSFIDSALSPSKETVHFTLVNNIVF